MSALSCRQMARHRCRRRHRRSAAAVPSRRAAKSNTDSPSSPTELTNGSRSTRIRAPNGRRLERRNAPGLAGNRCNRPSTNTYRLAALESAASSSSDKPKDSHNSTVSGFEFRNPFGPHSIRKLPASVGMTSDRMLPPGTAWRSNRDRWRSIS